MRQGFRTTVTIMARPLGQEAIPFGGRAWSTVLSIQVRLELQLQPRLLEAVARALPNLQPQPQLLRALLESPSALALSRQLGQADGKACQHERPVQTQRGWIKATFCVRGPSISNRPDNRMARNSLALPGASKPSRCNRH